MGYIDCDTHIYESDATWDYLDPQERQFRPATVVDPDTGLESWVVSDERINRGDRRTSFDPEKYYALYPPGAIDLSDVPARLAQMDELGVDVQVVFSTFFNQAAFGRPIVEAALARSWNRWVASRVAEGGGRLRWALRAPLRTMDRAFEEMEFGKAHGATGVQVQGQAHGMALDDEYLDPFYAKAQDLDLVINVHVGQDNHVSQRDPRNNFGGITQVVLAFHRLVVGDLAERFPRLRWSFVEAGASWLPFALNEAARDAGTGLRRIDDHTGFDTDLLARKHLFVATQIDDDLPYLVPLVGEDNLIVGTDYGHLDVGADMRALEIIASRDDVDRTISEKIVDRNGRRLHGIDASFTPSHAGVLAG